MSWDLEKCFPLQLETANVSDDQGKKRDMTTWMQTLIYWWYTTKLVSTLNDHIHIFQQCSHHHCVWVHPPCHWSPFSLSFQFPIIIDLSKELDLCIMYLKNDNLNLVISAMHENSGLICLMINLFIFLAIPCILRSLLQH